MKPLAPSFFVAGQRAAVATLVTSLLAGCATVGPDYHQPAPAVAASWQAKLPDASRNSVPESWWEQFHDPALTTLLHATETGNPTLDKAVAAIASARAAAGISHAGILPAVNGSASSLRSGDAKSQRATASTTQQAGLDASWEIDLFGGQRRANQAAQAKLDASVASWHDAQVALAAEVAQDYVNYRACRLTLKALQDSSRSQQDTARLTHTLVAAGLADSADGSLATAGAASSAAAVTAQAASCDVLIKSLVALTGTAEPELRTLLAANTGTLPAPAAFTVDSVPAELVRQRPDVVAAERKLAAASASIGVAEAKRYPSLSLAGSITLTAASAGTTAPWTFGPALALPLFDGGKTRAGVDSAQADYDAALADYRQSVRGAVKEVETALVNLDAANARAADVATSASAYRAYFQATETQWHAGGADLLTLEQTRRDALGAEQNLIAVQRDRLLYWIALYKALGGGWSGLNTNAAQAVTSSHITTGAQS